MRTGKVVTGELVGVLPVVALHDLIAEGWLALQDVHEGVAGEAYLIDGDLHVDALLTVQRKMLALCSA